MSEIFINKAKTCAVTGHRQVTNDLNVKNLTEIFEKLIDGGYQNFLIGMAVGFDTLCFKILENIRKKKDIKIIACIPCEKQDYNFSLEQKEQYRKMLLSADEKVLISKEYTPYCMQKRNRFMVDNASVLIAYLRKEKTGTSSTVNYAKRQDVSVIYV